MKVRYALVGGFAVMAWGQPRATLDVDALVDLKPPSVGALVAALAKESLAVVPEDLEDSLRGEGHTTIFDKDSSYHVDFKAARTPEERAQVEAAVAVEFENGSLRVARAEDTVAYKLLFGSEQDLKDARSILVRQGERLDRKLLRGIALRLGVVKALEGLERQLPGRGPLNHK